VTAHTTRAQPDGDVPLAPSRRHVLYEAVATLGAAVARLARAYEADPERCRDLQQDIHAEVWHSLARFDGRCSLRTWVYRVAHNVACTHVARARRRPDAVLVGLDELAEMPADGDGDATDRRLDMSRLLALIHRLPPLDRQFILLHLEGMDAEDIAEVTGLSLVNVHTKRHRLKKILAERFNYSPRGGA